MERIIIGIDESYTRTGITVLKGDERHQQVLRMFAVDFEGCKTNTEKRKELKEWLEDTFNHFGNKNITVIVERIRLRSQGFLSENYIKSTGALIATIIDVCQEEGIPVYSVDTRSWKSQIVGSSKPLQNPYGINPEKYPTILYIKRIGLLERIIKPYEGRGKKGIIPVRIKGKKVPCEIIDDIADSYCIAKYGFLPKSKQKLKEERF
jgi:Holliday junction resolvasome RuvABC endonuclease subunit